MEKILILNGSPRGKNGNTAVMVDLFLKGYKSVKSDVEIKHLELYKTNINNCIGCFNCWKKTPGKCIHRDDMDVFLEDYQSADLIIWATPLYHYGMTAKLKTFVERTLPLVNPYIVKKNGIFTHPHRYERNKQRNIVISNCGFPERHNFDVMLQSFGKIIGNNVDEEILCIMGELLGQSGLGGRLKWYKQALEQSGVEYGSENHISEDTKNILKKPLVPIVDFIEMANLSWEAVGETPPELEEALNENSNRNSYKGTKKHSKGLSYLKLMRQSFIKENAKDIDAILEIEFTDLNEINHFIIKNSNCELMQGPSDKFTTKILTSYETWLEISSGELDGAEAIMKGLYRVEGDTAFMMSMNRLFGKGEDEVIDSVETNESLNAKTKDNNFDNFKILGIPCGSWMSVLFIPWMISWIGISFNQVLGVWLPLVVTLGIVILKRAYNEVTYFEKTSMLYFSILGIIQIIEAKLLLEHGVLINYIAIALIWGVSVVDHKPLTSDYSKFTVSKKTSQNIIFIKTNEILTLFWSGIFILQSIIFVILKYTNHLKYTPFVYILIIVALKFTKWFSKWYPEYIMKGKAKKIRS